MSSGQLNSCDSRTAVGHIPHFITPPSSMSLILSGTLLSIISGLISALFVHLLAGRKSCKDELAKMRLEAYSDFLRASSRLVSARRTGEIINKLDDLGPLNEAKMRICVCADGRVVQALESFWLQGGTLERESEILAYAQLCQAMRESLGRDRVGPSVRLSEILFRLEPSTYSHRAHSSD